MLRLLRLAPRSSEMIVDHDYSKPDVSATKSDLSMVWVVGTFASYHVYDADGSNRFVYTEVTFHLDSVIHQPAPSSLVAGSTVDIVLLGGTIKTKEGAAHSFYLSPSQYALEPAHRYILALLPTSNGLFVVQQQWDVTTGTVQVSSKMDEEHVRKGESKLVGLSIEEATNFIQSALSPK